MNIRLLLSSTLISLFLMIQTASAALVESDWLVAGDNKLTIDTNSGLEWLDLTESTGFSMNQILAGAGGFLDMGFRYATTSEVSTLFAEANVIDTGGEAVEENAAAAMDFILLFGITYQASDSSGNNTFTSGYHFPDPPDTSESTIAAFVQLISFGEPPLNTENGYGAAMVSALLSGNRDRATSTDGSFLVREATYVPVPAAVWLFGSGLIGLLGMSMRMKSN